MNSEIIKELRAISAANDGLLLAEDVVAAAKPVKSPLHNSFTWDDTKAAYQHRLHQARMLIRVVVEVLPNGSDELVRVFVSLSPNRKEGGGYRETVAVLSNPDWKDQMLCDAKSEMECFDKKYRTLRELSRVISAMRKAGKRIQAEKVAA